MRAASESECLSQPRKEALFLSPIPSYPLGTLDPVKSYPINNEVVLSPLENELALSAIEMIQNPQ